MAKGARNKARWAREKAKPPRNKPDHSAYLIEPSAFEKLPREIRHTIYFFLGFTIANHILREPSPYSPPDTAIMDRADFMHPWKKVLPFWSALYLSEVSETNRKYSTKIENTALLRVCNSLRHELLQLLFNEGAAGINWHRNAHTSLFQDYMFKGAPPSQIRPMATISYITYFTLDCWLDSKKDTWSFRKIMMFMAKHAINLIGFQLIRLPYVDEPGIELHLNRMIRSLHDLVRTVSSEHFEWIMIDRCCKCDLFERLWKEDSTKFAPGQSRSLKICEATRARTTST